MIDIVAVSLNIQSKEHVSTVLFYFNFDAISLYNTILRVLCIYICIYSHLNTCTECRCYLLRSYKNWIYTTSCIFDSTKSNFSRTQDNPAEKNDQPKFKSPGLIQSDTPRHAKFEKRLMLSKSAPQILDVVFYAINHANQMRNLAERRRQRPPVISFHLNAGHVLYRKGNRERVEGQMARVPVHKGNMILSQGGFCNVILS